VTEQAMSTIVGDARSRCSDRESCACTLQVPRTPRRVFRRLEPAQVDRVVDAYLCGATLEEVAHGFEPIEQPFPSYWSSVASNVATLR